jgi:hypothetical protein
MLLYMIAANAVGDSTADQTLNSRILPAKSAPKTTVLIAYYKNVAETVPFNTPSTYIYITSGDTVIAKCYQTLFAKAAEIITFGSPTAVISSSFPGPTTSLKSCEMFRTVPEPGYPVNSIVNVFSAGVLGTLSRISV